MVNVDLRTKTIRDGVTAEELFQSDGLTYSDFIILPGFIDFGASDVQVSGQFTKKIRLHIPIVSSPMDTVTESEMARTMALMGGIGVLHNNCTVQHQVQMVRSVKMFRNGFIMKPKSVGPDTPISVIHEINADKGISGYLGNGEWPTRRQTARHRLLKGHRFCEGCVIAGVAIYDKTRKHDSGAVPYSTRRGNGCVEPQPTRVPASLE
ncbi:putative inosine-5'-monophosphate dehydrogenase [Trypanosoma cruzi]|uniref:Putative inosine-5'-monophosphate dehydrogenase n=1 Tax=Trypanosoma cruzi TaxID=5693 RepID=A0A2V2UJ67_TRYCR|nr:putative inosine-5'-monophosphate dehydrogenase [Trypanosoma cruzi]